MSLKKSLFYVFGFSLLFAIVISYLVESSPFFYEKKEIAKLIIANIYCAIPGLYVLFFVKKEMYSFKILTKISKVSFLALFLPVVLSMIGGLISLCFEKFSLERVIVTAKSFGLHFHSAFATAALMVLVLVGISILTSLTINFVFCLGEELFWRGYVWEKLRWLGFWRASLNIAILSSLWIVPNIVFFGYMYGKNSLIGVCYGFFLNLGLTPILCYFREREGAVMSSTIFRSMMNSFSPFVVVFFPDSNPLLVAPLGFSGILAVYVLVLFFLKQTSYKDLNVLRKAP